MIEVSQVSKKYAGNEHYSCHDISFHVKSNSICGILGHNGAGKSTLMKMLATLYQPNDGYIRIDGKDTVKDALQVRQRIGYVFETPRLYDELTGEENILFAARLFKVNKETALQKAATMYQELDVNYEKRIVKSYSKGMKQKIAIIRMLIADPDVILLDEPTSGLDIETRSQIRKYTARLRDEGKTILMTSHIAEDIEKLCDQVVILLEGELIENSSVAELKAKYQANSFEDVYLNLQNQLKKGDENH